ncbi:hypothetical protein [Mesorhizobium sp. B1-1-8]|uniref:hypothetical protein n=1 Tax=Mesorhizobium sp. B1-1-8 TaxID=2589976 RepID=UPI001D02CAA7|nr:hypothetical protein [Mesorhizobium sp. B1-1-8]UCI09942.1 hypothetical protein FJ974_13240 [Mesorhizobium sp. B1-1-8]
MADQPKRSHNGGPPLNDYEGPPWGKSDAYVFLAWRAAHDRAWKAPGHEIMLMRLERAERLGLTYEEYTFWSAGVTLATTMPSASPRSAGRGGAGGSAISNDRGPVSHCWRRSI